MRAQRNAMLVAVGSVAARLLAIRLLKLAGMTAAALAVTSCMPMTAPLAGADPADPGAKVASTNYRSTIAPYTGLRPTTPAPWRARNDRVAPAPKPGQ